MMMMRGAMTLLVPISLASPVLAQTNVQSAAPTAPVRGLESLQPQANTQAPADAVPIPAAPRIVLPTTPPAATPRAAARTTGSETARRSAPTPAATERPAPAATRTIQPVPAPAPSRTPTPEPAPPPAAAPAVTPQPQPAPAPAPAAVPAAGVAAPEAGRAMPFWLWLLVIPLVVGALWLLRRPRRNRFDDAEVEPVEAVEPEAQPMPVTAIPPAVAPPPAPRFLEPSAPAPVDAPRARLSVELRPLRAGLNMLSATATGEIVVTNTGDAPAERIRIGTALFTAHAGQDADLAAFNAGGIARPAAPPFALAPGETRSVRVVAAIAREAIRTMTAAGRPMFVPILAANTLYDSGEGEGQIARAWAIGIERVDSAKLAPFWLDAPDRMYDAVAARPHAAALER